MLDLAPAPRDAPTDRPMVITVGRIESSGGVEQIIGAIARLRAAGSEVHYVVAIDPDGADQATGAPTTLAELAEIARRCAVADLVELAPAHDWSALRALIRRADVVVVPCAPGDIAQPQVLAEAAAAGKPVVAAECADARDLGRVARLDLVRHTAPRYASAINKVLSRARPRQRMHTG
jgi:glycosyltransferase involved in cell wall biosynthesis